MEPGYINIAEIEFICDAGPLTMVVMKTSYFDQQRVERKRRRRKKKKKKSSKGAGMRRGCLLCTWLRFTPLSGRRNRERSILHLDLSRRGAKFGGFFCPRFQGRGLLFDPHHQRWWLSGRKVAARGFLPNSRRRGREGRGWTKTRTSCSEIKLK